MVIGFDEAGFYRPFFIFYLPVVARPFAISLFFVLFIYDIFDRSPSLSMLMNSAFNAKFKIAPTAGVALSLARDVYQDPLSRIFYDNIDHSETAAFREQVEQSYWHVVNMVVFRKRFIRSLFDAWAAELPQFQVCILAAGLDPLSLYLLEKHGSRVSRIFEADRAFMTEKREMYGQLQADTERITLLSADVTGLPDLLGEMKLYGYDPAQPTIFLLEGLTYYISRSRLYGMLEALKDSGSRVIVEYGQPYEVTPARDREQYRRLIESVEQNTDFPMHLYHRSDMERLVRFMGGHIASVSDLKEMEHRLDGRNAVFSEEAEGGIELIAFSY